MRVISLVVEGLERAAETGCLTWLFAQDADIICLQDTRCAEHGLKGQSFFPDHYHPYFLDHYDNPLTNGVAIYCKRLPKAIIWGLGLTSSTLRVFTSKPISKRSVSGRYWCLQAQRGRRPWKTS